MAGETTRRAIFAGAAALPVAAALPASAATSPLAEQWAKVQALTAFIDGPETRGWPDDRIDAAVDRLFEMEAAVLAAPIRSREDALIKLECAALSAEKGARCDWKDMEAVADVAAYFRQWGA